MLVIEVIEVNNVVIIYVRSSNLGDFTHDIRMLAALQEDDNHGTNLMHAARRLAGGLSDLLNAVQPERREVCSIYSMSVNIFHIL